VSDGAVEKEGTLLDFFSINSNNDSDNDNDHDHDNKNNNNCDSILS
jgi:hypothetical protein